MFEHPRGPGRFLVVKYEFLLHHRNRVRPRAFHRLQRESCFLHSLQFQAGNWGSWTQFSIRSNLYQLQIVICIKLKRGLAKVPELANSSICEVLYPHMDINLHNKLDVGIIIRKPYFTDMEIEALAQTGVSNARLHTFLCKLFN